MLWCGAREGTCSNYHEIESILPGLECAVYRAYAASSPGPFRVDPRANSETVRKVRPLVAQNAGSLVLVAHKGLQNGTDGPGNHLQRTGPLALWVSTMDPTPAELGGRILD